MELPERNPGDFRKFHPKICHRSKVFQDATLEYRKEESVRQSDLSMGGFGKVGFNDTSALPSTRNVISIFIIQKFSKRKNTLDVLLDQPFVSSRKRAKKSKETCLLILNNWAGIGMT